MVLFTRDDLIRALPSSWCSLRALTVRRYWEESSEELLEVHICRLADADSACHFWIESVRNTLQPPARNYTELKEEWWWHTYGKNFLFQPTDAAEICKRFNEIRGSRWEEALVGCGEIAAAMKIFDDWNLWWIVGCSEHSWFAVYWETTA